MKQRFAIDAIYGKPLFFGILHRNFPPVYWKTVQTAPPAFGRAVPSVYKGEWEDEQGTHAVPV